MLAENTVNTKELMHDKITAIKLKIKQKKEALALKQTQLKQKETSIKSLETFKKEWTD